MAEAKTTFEGSFDSRSLSSGTIRGVIPIRGLRTLRLSAGGGTAVLEPFARRPAHIRLLGEFRLSSADGAPVSISSRRLRGLLAYLVFAPDHAATRERLCGLLWGDRGEMQARASLRQCLVELKALLAADSLDIVDLGRERIALKAGALDTDLAALKRALELDDAAAVGMLSSMGAERFLGDLDLDGTFREWVAQTRSRVDRDISAAVIAHLERLEARGDWQAVRRTADIYSVRIRLTKPSPLARCEPIWPSETSRPRVAGSKRSSPRWPPSSTPRRAHCFGRCFRRSSWRTKRPR